VGAALCSVSAAYAAVSSGRFDELAPLLAADLDWCGIAGSDGRAPSCHGREMALAVMRRGLAAAVGAVSVREFVEYENRVLARVVRLGASGEPVYFVVADVHEGEITRLRAFASEREARAALGVPSGTKRGLAAPLLLATGIAKSFGRKRVLDGVSLQARAGEAVAIVGENGAGKSTLLRIVAGLEHPDTGTVRVHGRTGYCPQHPGLFDLLTADEHLALFAPALGLSREDGVREGARLLGELGFAVGDRTQARRLSGGARQKLNLALALLGDARLLLLDEPYQGFDHGAYVSFWEHVARWRADGLAVVIVTHLLADTALVDRVVELAIPRDPSVVGNRR
jgi:ABC-type nitrate/sulfonate/bicarbonate transport system ATPase subunit/ketosteroid isomerase-like protein